MLIRIITKSTYIGGWISFFFYMRNKYKKYQYNGNTVNNFYLINLLITLTYEIINIYKLRYNNLIKILLFFTINLFPVYLVFLKLVLLSVLTVFFINDSDDCKKLSYSHEKKIHSVQTEAFKKFNFKNFKIKGSIFRLKNKMKNVFIRRYTKKNKKLHLSWDVPCTKGLTLKEYGTLVYANFLDLLLATTSALMVLI